MILRTLYTVCESVELRTSYITPHVDNFNYLNTDRIYQAIAWPDLSKTTLAMADTMDELDERFAPPNTSLAPEVKGELQSIMRLHSLTPQDLFYKWESYGIKMGMDSSQVDLQIARDFKKDLQEVLERESRGKVAARGIEAKRVGATPRNVKSTGIDMFGMIDGVSSGTPRTPMAGVNGNSIKRKSAYDTPASKYSKSHTNSSPGDNKTPLTFKESDQPAPFSQRQNAGQVMETLNNQIPIAQSPLVPFPAPRIKLKANTELNKFAYKNMAMKLSEASEILDDRIDEFLSLVQKHHGLEDGAFGNPASQSASEVVAVGRIASDSSSGKLNLASVVLETSRRTGAGLRVPLKFDNVPAYELFPGKIIAVRGSNASGQYFTVSDVLDIPQLAAAASTVQELEAVQAKLKGDLEASQPLNIIISSGPYTADTNLDYEPLHALCEKAESTCADALILSGPFLDIEHPMIASGAIPPLPSSLDIDPDTATLTDVFCGLVSLPLQALVKAVPSITIILVPSVRDAINKHVSWPQDRVAKKDLRLPKQVSIVTNPITLSLNEIIVGVSSQDVLYELRQGECAGGNLLQQDGRQDLLARLSRHVIDQRHFFPLFPSAARDTLPKPTPALRTGAENESQPELAAGAMVDISYLALGDWPLVKPDILILPSVLNPFAKVVESVVVCNPGTLSKRRGPGTYAQFTIQPPVIEDAERGEDGEADGHLVGHRLFDRARIDITRI